MKILSALLVLPLFGCAGATREPCPTPEAEPVSTCRAIERCRDQRALHEMGGIGISQSQNSESYTGCVDQDLKDQENQMKAKREVTSESPTPVEK